MSQTPITLTTETFDTEVLQSDIPVLIDIWAPWCAPCRMIGPIVEQIAEENTGRIKVGKLNIDDNMDIGRKYEIQSIPALMLFKNGEPVAGIIGLVSKPKIQEMIDKHLEKD